MSKWKCIYQFLALIIIFYVAYQGYLISNITHTVNDKDGQRLQMKVHESVEHLNQIENKRRRFEDMIYEAQYSLNVLESIKHQNHIRRDSSHQSIPILVIAYNRPTVSRALDSILAARSQKADLFPIIISQDGDHLPTQKVIKAYCDKYNNTHYIQQPNRTVPWQVKQNLLGYYKLSRHYKFALDTVFNMYPNAEAVIIVEDDLEVSPDFVSYFKVLLPLLLEPAENLYCISAWNDNGKEGQIENDPRLLHRTDFFGGLGWMLKKETWMNEWSNEWPDAFWDDWVRGEQRRKGRSCIRPEISRTSTFGKVGVSMGQFFDKHLAHIHHYNADVDWSHVDIANLKRLDYDTRFISKLKGLAEISHENIHHELQYLRSRTNPKNPGKQAVKIVYHDKREFVRIASDLSIMDDFKAGVPRGGYKGVVQTVKNSYRIYITPPNPETWVYDSSW